MDQGNPNPNKYFVCSSISPRTEFSEFQEAVNYFNSVNYYYDIMIIEHQNCIFVLKRYKGRVISFCISL